ncbi:MAG: hypothetical protein DHS20C14_02210 [Phycisphaeraceae bacterium]|nr:MAG: hypothetical protein DHS20C14_02210 [Phycisphaeraceae bacterium]
MKIQMAAVALVAATGFAHADVLGFEDFDGGAINLSGTANVFDYGAGGGTAGDVFGRVGGVNQGGPGMPFDMADDSVAGVSGSPFPGDSLGLAGQNTSNFFGMNDMDGNIDGAGGSLNNAVWSFNIGGGTIDDITIDIAALGDFEASSGDGFLIEAQVDGGGYAAIFQGICDENLFHDYRAFDDGTFFSDDDPLVLSIDGVATGTILDKSDAASGDFDSFVSTLFAGVSGNNVDIRISWGGTPSGSEPMGMDNITINGVIPAPGAFALLGLGGLAAVRRRR